MVDFYKDSEGVVMSYNNEQESLLVYFQICIYKMWHGLHSPHI